MRALSARRLASAAVTATLLIGITAPAAVAVDNESKRERIEEAAKAPLPGVDGLLAQTKTLGDLGGLLAPVTDVLNAVLKADDGQISPEQATTLLDALKAAIAKILAVAPVPVPVPLPTDPPATTVPTTPPVTAPPADALPLPVPLPLPALPLPADKSGDDSKAPSADAVAPSADAVGDALTALQTAVGELLAAATSGDPTTVVPAATKVVSALLNAILALLLGGGLPLPLPVDLPVPVPLPLPLPAS